MSLLIIGIAVSFNILIILHKFTHNRVPNAILDLLLLCIVTYVFMGSFDALVVGTIASAVVSIYLWFVPVIPQRSTHATT